MGMYTEFHFNAELKQNTPQDVLDILDYMVNGRIVDGKSLEYEGSIPHHPLFITMGSRWKFMLRCDSYYFDAQTRSEVVVDDLYKDPQHVMRFLCIRCNLKNYNSEIQMFVDWINDYLDVYPDEFLGFYRYEESEWPTLIHFPSQYTNTTPSTYRGGN